MMDKTELNEVEKARTVQRLADMFTTRSEQQVRRLCEEFNWNVQRCVDRLICETLHLSSASKISCESTTTTTTTTTAQADKTRTTEVSAPILLSSNPFKIHQNGAIPKNNKNNSSVGNNEVSSKNSQARKFTTTASPNKIRNNKYNAGQFNHIANGAKVANDNNAAASVSLHRRICGHIRSGYRVVIIMRGAPGSGKSTLAQSLLRASLPLDKMKEKLSDFIFSTDEFFFDVSGRYNFNPQALPDAHLWNQNRVRDKARAGWSPIVVDNTNIRLWEMMPYVEVAVQNGYLIELLEPNTSWRQSASKLAIKNTHQVSRESIQRALSSFERASVNDLLKMLKNSRYNVSLPQMRLKPPHVARVQPLHVPALRLLPKPIPITAPAPAIAMAPPQEPMSTEKEQETVENAFLNAQHPPDLQADNDVEIVVKQETMPTRTDCPLTAIEQGGIVGRKDIKDMTKAQAGNDEGQTDINNISNTAVEGQAWQPYEQEALNYWGQQPLRQREESPTVKEGDEKTTKKSLLDLLRESVNDTQLLDQREESKTSDECTTEALNMSALRRHCINCPNESSGFAALRQIYPNKHATGLWDLFVKCNGDVDWAVDILLKEDELAVHSGDVVPSVDEGLVDFTCDCTFNVLLDSTRQVDAQVEYAPLAAMPTTQSKPQRQLRPRRTNPERREMQLQIEHCFVLGDEQYSAHTRKIRDIRNGVLDAPFLAPGMLAAADQQNAVQSEAALTMDDEDDEANAEADGKQLVEIELGEKLVQQLCAAFRTETTLGERLPEQYATNVFIPRAMAKQLHMLWLENVYNQVEEQKQQTLREDEQFARLLKNPKYADVQETPNNVNELLDMELAWSIYNDDKQRQDERMAELAKPNDIATHLTKMKLCEQFPDIPRETLLDVYSAQGHSYSKTLLTLGIDELAHAAEEVTQDDLIERAKREHERLNRQAEQEVQQQQHQATACENGNADERDNSGLPAAKTTQVPDERKRLALHDFEKTRNMAAHHSQLKAECYLRAKEAIQKGNGGAAIYYSEIANLHKRKIDMYNHRAANCIMEVHRYTQNNPDLLDLHYLHVLEAISCLDLFLDQHITMLRAIYRPYKQVFIITGRGLHSAGGISTIKNKVKVRLKERGLKWTDVNPGLLKVKIFSASRHANNLF